MAGLTSSGFVPETLEDIQERIKGKLELINPGFDFSPESPDGQLVEIFAFELWNAWTQLDLVYNSYNPAVATGAALRNIGLISGLTYGTANRSYATIELQGTAGTVVPANSIVTDDDGNEFYVAFNTTIPSNAQVISRVPGPIPVPISTLTTITTPISGWTSITQTTAGTIGTLADSEQKYRNLRQTTVMRNYTSVVDTMQARLLELGVDQASVFNNDATITVDGVPANTIAVTVGEVGTVTDESIATVIFETNAVGCPTFGSTTTSITDVQGFSHDINFTKASAVTIEIEMDITFLDTESAGAIEQIKTALVGHIESLLAGEDVIWSRLFTYITPYGKAQVNTLTIARAGDAQGTANLVMTDTEYASMLSTDITIVES